MPPSPSHPPESTPLLHGHRTEVSTKLRGSLTGSLSNDSGIVFSSSHSEFSNVLRNGCSQAGTSERRRYYHCVCSPFPSWKFSYFNVVYSIMGPTGCGKSQVRLWLRTRFIGIIAKSIQRLLICSLASLESVLKIPFNLSPRMLLLFEFWTTKHTVAISFWLTHLVSMMWIGATRKSWR